MMKSPLPFGRPLSAREIAEWFARVTACRKKAQARKR
jgi:hypothetical protein